MVGWWYNKDLFAKAGIQAPPTTWTEFLDEVKKLKAAGITPIALGEKDSWTGMHIWSYLATRIGGKAAFEAALNRTGSFADPAFVQAFEKLQELIALEPFQDGFLGATHDEMQATFGNGKAAMELSGQWAPSVESANARTRRALRNLGMFGFPAVEGGAGAATDVIGGGNGFAIGKNASPEAIDFAKYILDRSRTDGDGRVGHGHPGGEGRRGRPEGRQHARGPEGLCGCEVLPAILRSVLALGSGRCDQRVACRRSSRAPRSRLKLPRRSKTRRPSTSSSSGQ